MGILRRIPAVLCLGTSLAILVPAFAAGTPAVVVLVPAVVIAALRPILAAMIAAAATPLATGVMVLLGQRGEWVELLIFALAAGSAARWLARPPAPLRHLAIPALVFVVIVLASLAVQMLVLRTVLSAEVFGPAALDALRGYASQSSGITHFLHTAGRLLEGVFLLALVTDAAIERRHAIAVLRCSAGGGALAALITLGRLAASAARTEHPVESFFLLAGSVRFSFPYPDVNAAGSYFALVLLVAAGFAAAASRLSSRAGWVAAAVLAAAALWISGSRAAVLACLAALGLLAVRRLERRTAPYVIIGLVLLAATAIRLFPNPILDRSATGAIGIRVEMARASMRMLRLDPVFGIGIGQFYERSADYIQDPAVKAVYLRENAHNNFLQIATELGILGIVTFVAIVAMALRPAVAGRQQLEWPVHAAVLGIGAFLLTCVAGHPLLTNEVSAAFWVVLGCVAAATRAPDAPGGTPGVAKYVAIAACAVVLASVPWRVHRDIGIADLEHVGHGVSPWHRDESGRLYRQMLHDATLFVPREAAGIEVPYRLGQPGAPVTLEFLFRGRLADRLVVQDDQWRTRRVVVPRDRSLPLYAPLTIKVLEGDPTAVWLGKVTTIGGR